MTVEDVLMPVEDALRRIKDCRDDYRCEREKACFTLMRFVELRLQLDVIEEYHEDSDDLQYFSEPVSF